MPIHDLFADLAARHEERFDLIQAQLQDIQTLLKEIRTTMPTQTDLDNAIAAIGSAVQKLGSDVTAEIAALQAKAAAGEDFTQEVTNLTNIGTQLSTIDAAAIAASPAPATSGS